MGRRSDVSRFRGIEIAVPCLRSWVPDPVRGDGAVERGSAVWRAAGPVHSATWPTDGRQQRPPRPPPDFRRAGIVRTGVPHKEIVAAAAREKADVIVLGTQGRGGLARARVGSVADRVIRLAPCPVLTVRERG